MPIFDDPKKELNRLQRQLLEEDAPEQEAAFIEEYLDEEDWLDEEIAEAKALLGYEEEEDGIPVRNYANGYGRNLSRPVSQSSRPAYRGHVNDYEEEIPEEPEENLRGLVILACLLALGIVAVAAYWVVLLL